MVAEMDLFSGYQVAGCTLGCRGPDSLDLG